jgi:hypothetical protein
VTVPSFRPILACIAAILAPACGQDNADPSRPGSFAVRMPVEPAPGEGLQRLQLPAAALVGVQRQDLADVRIFDGKGAALPAALVDEGALVDPEKEILDVPAYPVVGRTGALSLSGVTLRIEDGERARILGAEGEVQRGAGGEAGIIGALLDTREVRDPAVSLQLDMELPAGQPVAFTFEKSRDLASWQPLAEKVFFRAEGAADVLGTPSVRLQSVSLEDHYVRAGWSTASPPTAPIRVTAARVVTSKQAASRRVSVSANTPGLVDAHKLQFTVPFAARLSAIRLSGVEEAAIVPVTVHGRSERDEPWRLLGAGIVRNGEALIELRDSGFGQYRLTADERTAGFASAPRLELLFEPAVLLVQFSGAPPYTLATGLSAAPGSYLALEEILPEGTDAALLPEAAAKASDGASPVIALAAPDDESTSPRRLVLWLVLALGVVVLGFAVWRLMAPGRRGEAADMHPQDQA